MQTHTTPDGALLPYLSYWLSLSELERALLGSSQSLRDLMREQMTAVMEAWGGE